MWSAFKQKLFLLPLSGSAFVSNGAEIATTSGDRVDFERAGKEKFILLFLSII
jgi:hypothetical protein